MSIKAKLKRNPVVIYNYRLIKKLPSFICTIIRDALRYLVHSRMIVGNNEEKRLQAEITATAHVVEKGFAMPEPRKGFGQDVIKSLIYLMNEYERREFNPSHNSYVMAISALKNYLEFNNKFDLGNIKGDIIIAIDKSDKFTDNMPNISSVLKLNKDDIIKKSKGNFEELANSRYSIRQFSDEPVDIKLVKEAISIARKTPSVCNRQCARIYIIEDKKQIKEILKVQQGNRGFGHTFDKLLIVASELNVFEGSNERNQAFTDGGMFAMSLTYALHYKGIGSCIINWCPNGSRDKKLRSISNIKPSHEILLMIGIGNIPDKITVAASSRISIDEVIVQ
jgi:nitroreductase